MTATHDRATAADLAGHVCHEVRKPITAIRAYAELLEDGISGGLNEEQREYVGVVLRGARRLDEQVTCLYELAVLAAGAPAPERGPADLGELCASVQDTTAEAFGARGQRLHFEEATTDVRARVDAPRIQVALARLVRCALQTSSSDVTLVLDRDGPDALLYARTPGSTLPSERFESAFEPFGLEPHESASGLGVELHLVRAAARSHAGDAWLERDERGTRFTLRLPR